MLKLRNVNTPNYSLSRKKSYLCKRKEKRTTNIKNKQDMKDTNTKMELWNAYRQASEMGMQLYKIASQPTHPTLENERTNAAHLAYEYAKSIHAAIIDLEDGHTTDAKDMAHHYMSIAERFEREGMQQRTDLQFAATWDQRDALQLAAKASLTKATAWRYAACLLADENAIDITIGGAK